MHRFRQPSENKFGTKPPLTRIKPENIEKSIESALPMVMNKAQPIWEFLGISEVEYYEQYHKQPVSENALEIQQNIVPESDNALEIQQNIVPEMNMENVFLETNL